MTSRYHWVNHMSVGKGALDTQHKKLLSQIQRTIDAVTPETPLDEVSHALSYLERYMDTHFSYEENYMRRRTYAKFGEHVKVHRRLTDELEALRFSLNANYSPAVWLTSMYSFGDSMVQHMYHEDRDYHASLGEKVRV